MAPAAPVPWPRGLCVWSLADGCGRAPGQQVLGLRTWSVGRPEPRLRSGALGKSGGALGDPGPVLVHPLCEARQQYCRLPMQCPSRGTWCA